MKEYPAFFALFLLMLSIRILAQYPEPLFEIPRADIHDFCFFHQQDSLAIATSKGIEVWMPDNRSRLTTLVTSSQNTFHCLAISHDNKWLAAGTKDGTVVMWNIQTGKLLWEATAEGLITDLSISGDNQTIAAGSSNTLIYMIDLQTGEIKKTYQHHSLDITAVRFIRNGQYLISSSGDEWILLWNTANHKVMLRINDHNNWIRDLSVNHDETRMVSCDDNGLIYKWNISNPDEFRLLEKERISNYWLTSVYYYPDGKGYLTTDLKGQLTINTFYGSFEGKFNGIPIKTEFWRTPDNNPVYVILLKDKGLQMIHTESVKLI